MRVCAAGMLAAMLAGDVLAASGDEFLLVDCALPGQIRQLGQKITYLSPRRPVKTTAGDCRRRGGEYVVADLADPRQAVGIWLNQAESGDAQAMVTIGEILERAAASSSDYAEAASWYRRAAELGNRRAQVNLGYLHEQGLGVEPDPAAADRLYRLAAGLSADTDSRPTRLVGPRITIIQPVQAEDTRGLVRVVAPRAPVGEIVGRVTTDHELVTLQVDGTPIEINPSGLFTARIERSASGGSIEIVAVDRQGNRSAMELDFSGATDPRRDGALVSGRAYHALLIGNNEYRKLRDLRTPLADVAALEQLLQERYGFKVRVLVNATRYQILSALNRLRATLTPDDNLLIYYAGHGELDDANSRGHWLPVDAEPDSTANWLSNVAVTDIVNAIRARQVLVIADSCYSGTLTRSSVAQLATGMTESERASWLRVISQKRARLVLTSGGVVPVMDAGGGKHSVFAKALLETLATNADVLPGRALYQAVTARVTHRAAGYEFEQVPEFAPLARAGHEAGDFLLVPVGI